MKIYLVASVLADRFPGEFAPHIWGAANEYQLEENPKILDEPLAKAKKFASSSNPPIITINAGIVCVDVGRDGQETMRKQLAEPKPIKGKVE